jgi:hypothetical protein
MARSPRATDRRKNGTVAILEQWPGHVKWRTLRHMRMLVRTAMGLIGLALLPAVVSAELRHVQIKVTGLD